MAFSFGGLGPERFFRYILYIFSNALLEGLATQICHFYFLSLSANLFAYLTFFFSLFSLFGLLDFLIFLFSPPPSLYIHTLFVPFTFLGKRRDFKYRYITCSPLVPAANIDMSPLPTFYVHSHSYLSLFLTRKKIFLLLSFSLISYLFLSFLPYSFSRLLFRSFFSFSLLSSKISSKDFLILGGNLSCQPLCATSQSTKTSDQFDNCNNAVVTLNNWIEIQTVSQTT